MYGKSRIMKIILLYMGIIMITAVPCGCGRQGRDEKIRDLDFTVVEEADLPERLMTEICAKRKEPFVTTFSDEKFLYIARGYGEKKSGGYSIQVKELYLTDNSVFISTELLGPSQQDLVAQVCTYPYIVVKLEFIDKSVVFN